MYIDDSFVQKYDALITDRLIKNGLGRNSELFDEIKGKVYERILRSNNFDPKKGSISTWLWNICRSVISNELKRKRRSQDAMDHDPADIDELTHFVGQDDAGTAKDEVDRVLRNSGLSQRDQSIVKSYWLDEMQISEVADKYSLEQRAAEQVIFRAMKALRKSVQEDV